MNMVAKANILLIGGGGVGTMAAYALETGGKATVTAVLRSNFQTVQEKGFDIDSVDHGKATGWKPSYIRNSIPDVAKEGLPPYDFVVVTTKNIADVKPTVADLISPAVTPGKSAIVLLQNGLNIEKPVIAAFPDNAVVSGVSMIGATETSHGTIRHDDPDYLIISPFKNPVNAAAEKASEEASRRFVDCYAASGKAGCVYEGDVAFTRWKKLMYNASFNSVCTILRMDTSRMRFSEHVIDDLILPIMREIRAAALAVAGVELPAGQEMLVVNADPYESFFKPSMTQDIEKGNFIEFENIVGEPLREAERVGVAAPTLRVVYGLLRGLQFQVMEARGLVVVPRVSDDGSRYMKSQSAKSLD